MDFLITGFLYWVWNTLFGDKEEGSGSDLNDMENGAAYFFSVDPLERNASQDSTPSPSVENDYNDYNDYDDGPNW